MVDLNLITRNAREAAKTLANTSTTTRNKAIEQIAQRVLDSSAAILKANRVDLELASKNGMKAAMLDRLMLNQARIEGIVKDLRQITTLPDPVGQVFERKVLPNGLKVRKQRVPLGVIAIIYESRPNVTIDVAGICLKSGNAAILRGGKESLNTNCAFMDAIQAGIQDAGLPESAIQLISDPDREVLLKLLQLRDEIDLLIPRGGAGLHQFCKENSRIPVITGGIGICHLYVDESVDQARALDVIRNAKVQRPTVCNALDTVLVHQNIAAEFLPNLAKVFEQEQVTIQADEKSLQIIKSFGNVNPAGEDDFDTEWLALIAGVRIVADLEEAINHIACHSSGHSDGILTNSPEHAEKFVQMVDSAAVYVNASTRFTDGSQLGLGAEIAISTQRLHARGPMALEELMTYKWVIEGDYQVRP